MPFGREVPTPITNWSKGPSTPSGSLSSPRVRVQGPSTPCRRRLLTLYYEISVGRRRRSAPAVLLRRTSLYGISSMIRTPRAASVQFFESADDSPQATTVTDRKKWTGTRTRIQILRTEEYCPKTDVVRRTMTTWPSPHMTAIANRRRRREVAAKLSPVRHAREAPFPPSALGGSGSAALRRTRNSFSYFQSLRFMESQTPEKERLGDYGQLAPVRTLRRSPLTKGCSTTTLARVRSGSEEGPTDLRRTMKSLTLEYPPRQRPPTTPVR